VIPWAPLAPDDGSGCRGFVGSLPVLYVAGRLLRRLRWDAEALCWSGVAVWSADQLASEVSRGSWCLSPGAWRDVRSPFESAGDLWEDVVGREGGVSATVPPPPRVTRP
jgi:hypothetical protein